MWPSTKIWRSAWARLWSRSTTCMLVEDSPWDEQNFPEVPMLMSLPIFSWRTGCRAHQKYFSKQRFCQKLQTEVLSEIADLSFHWGLFQEYFNLNDFQWGKWKRVDIGYPTGCLLAKLSRGFHACWVIGFPGCGISQIGSSYLSSSSMQNYGMHQPLAVSVSLY